MSKCKDCCCCCDDDYDFFEYTPTWFVWIFPGAMLVAAGLTVLVTSGVLH